MRLPGGRGFVPFRGVRPCQRARRKASAASRRDHSVAGPQYQRQGHLGGDQCLFPRQAVADVRTGKVLYYTYVAHGKGSGGKYATRFSNTPGTNASSLGVYLTGHTYYGKHGYSLRLKGLNPEYNGAAYRRDIVMHSAWYVSRTFAKDHGRMGRSWGCVALSRKVESAVVKLIRGGTVLLAYYPDAKWLRSSPFLRLPR
ncbi:MAG: murein L,D-transpeptidase catalytic domain family protein [Gammaproteobacteria bacterium]